MKKLLSNLFEKSIELNDYKDILLISDGFLTSTYTVEPSFIPIQKVDYLKIFFLK